MLTHQRHQFRELIPGERTIADIDNNPRAVEELRPLIELAAQRA
jgi:hypothetical protein